MVCVMPHFLHFCDFGDDVRCLKWTPSIVLECCLVFLSAKKKKKKRYTKTVMCLMEKIRLLGKLCSGMSYSVAGYEFNVNEPTIYIE